MTDGLLVWTCTGEAERELLGRTAVEVAVLTTSGIPCVVRRVLTIPECFFARGMCDTRGIFDAGRLFPDVLFCARGNTIKEGSGFAEDVFKVLRS